MKCVIVVNENLPLGLIANTSAVLAMSIGKNHDHLVGSDVEDQDGIVHPGITQIPIPLLKGNDDLIKSIREKVFQEEMKDEIYMVDFCDLAQKSKKYEEYIEKMQTTPTSEMSYLGVALYGPAKKINTLTGSIGLLR